MSIVVVGSIAFDTIKTPFGQRTNSLGGAANYFALAAKFFSRIQMVGIVGDDFPSSHLQYLEQCGIDISGVERALGPSFHWHGEYGFDLNEAKTISTHLNVFEHFMPTLPKGFADASTIFLANIDPELQIHVLRQLKNPRIRALDTMNFWIQNKNKELKKAISMVDLLFINDSEIRALSGEHNIVKAARAVHKLGARVVVIKRGEYGSLMCMDNEIAFVPAYPLEDVFDPTGAGDSFAGGFLGFLDQVLNTNLETLKQAMLMGTVMSSFVIENFSFDRLLQLKSKDIDERKTRLLNIAKIHWPE